MKSDKKHWVVEVDRTWSILPTHTFLCTYLHSQRVHDILRKMNELVVAVLSLMKVMTWKKCRLELAYKERKGELFQPGWLVWAAEAPR